MITNFGSPGKSVVRRLARFFACPLRSLSLVILAVAALAIATRSASAVPINYGDHMGTDVWFRMVTENSGTDPLLFPPNSNQGLFGAPFVSGNSMDFNPQNFFANSDFQAPPFDRTDGHLTFMIEAKPGQAINNINFAEGGGLGVSGFGTDSTFVDVSAIGFIQVHDVDGVGINVQTIQMDMPFNFGVGGNGTWRLGTEGSVNGFLWTGSMLFDINQELANRGINFNLGATKISVSLDNLLLAQSEPQSGAFIDKKNFELTVEVNIPEPTTVFLGAIALMVGALSAGRRRR
jgi:hypothetical protein